MSAFLTLDQVALDTPEGTRLFSDLTLAVGREIVGVVGRNGAGKSTLLRTIAGGLQPAAGHVAASGRVAFLRQGAIEPGETVAAALGIADRLAVLDRIDRGAAQPGDLETADWTLGARVEAGFEKVGLTADPARAAGTLSGGERMRLALARLILEEPDLILLDEPTNNLDEQGRMLVGEFLDGWPGGALIASHDRTLLENVDRIVELSPVGTTVFGGGWSAFAAVREAERDRSVATAEQAQARVRAVSRSVQTSRERQARRQSGGRDFARSGSVPRIAAGLSKRRAETTAGKIASGGVRMIGEAESEAREARLKVERITPLSIELPPTGLPANRVVVSAVDLTLEWGGRRLFGLLSFSLRGPERVAIAGPNGAGKSSLMRLITGELQPTSGQIECNVPAAYLDQHIRILRDDLSLLENLLLERPALTAHDARASLARFGFRNRDALRRASALSGGERLRAGLACCMTNSEPIQLLLLDEPTNHLDIDSVAVLERALLDYDGAFLVVSHDPAFLEAIGVQRTIDLKCEYHGS